MREVTEGAERGVEAMRLALDVYVHRLRGSIAAMAAAVEGLDALVFTGGVGENSAAVRAAAVAGLGFLGLGLDAGRNQGATPDADVSDARSAASVLVIAAREDLEIARQVRAVLQGPETSEVPSGEPRSR
jgi:acetate kinase